MFGSEMIIANGCQGNIYNSITLGCWTKKEKKKIWPNLIKRHGWMSLKGWWTSVNFHFLGLCIYLNTQTHKKKGGIKWKHSGMCVSQTIHQYYNFIEEE